MSTTLQQVLTERAERAAPAPDIDAVMAAIRVRSARRTRRTQFAAGGGATIIAAAAAAIVVVAASGDDGHSGSLPAGNGGVPTQNAHPDPAVVSASKARLVRQARERALAARAAVSAERAAAAAAAKHIPLVRIDPAPPAAEVSITLVPKGFVYVGHDTAVTGYGPPKSAGTGVGDFTNKIAVDVHERLRSDGPYPLMINGRPASYTASGGFTSVRIVYDKTTDVGFQAPPSAHLTRNQALRIARTLDVRSTARKTKG